MIEFVADQSVPKGVLVGASGFAVFTIQRCEKERLARFDGTKDSTTLLPTRRCGLAPFNYGCFVVTEYRYSRKVDFTLDRFLLRRRPPLHYYSTPHQSFPRFSVCFLPIHFLLLLLSLIHI